MPAFHGWKVLLCAFLVALFGWGLGFYGNAVLVAALAAGHGWSTAVISGSVTFYYVLAAGIILFTARAFERFGPRRVVLAGVAAMGVGTLGIAAAQEPWQLYPASAVRAIGWAWMSGASLNLMLAPWFQRRRGLAISVAFNGASVGGMVVAPLLIFSVGALGLRTGVLLCVLLMVAVLVPTALAWLHRGPEVLGQGPDGDPLPAVAAPRPVAPSPAAPRLWAALQLPSLREWRFLSVAFAFALGLLAQVGFITHQVALLRPALGESLTAWTVSMTALAAFVGRVVTGLFVDRVDRRRVAAGNFLVQAGALALVLAVPAPATYMLGSVLFGLGVGNMISLPGLIVQVEYPAQEFGMVLSNLVAINMFTLAFGPSLLGLLHDATGSYSAALGVCASIELGSAVLMLSGRRAAA